MAGQEICTNYIDIKKPRSERRRELKQHYYFECECDRCNDGIEDMDLWNKVSQLNERMDALIGDETMNENTKFRDVYLLGIQTLPLYERVYGEYHPDLTIQLMRIMKARAHFEHPDESATFVGNRLRSSIDVTHGRDHSLYKVFAQLFL